MQPLEGKVALVTGSGRGIGAATARKLTAEGARVIVNDLDAVEAEQIAATLDGAIAAPADLTDAGAADYLVNTAIEKLGGLDIVVNNAGYIWNSAIHNMTDDQWDAMIDIHAKAQFRILRSYGQWLRHNANRESPIRKVVNISSLSGVYGAATQFAYSAGKAAVIGMTRTLAKEWGRFNVTVNAVAFGAVDTRLTAPYDDTPHIVEVKGHPTRTGLTREQIRHSEAGSPLGRIGQVEDAANSIYLFCIPESDWITGEVINASGGVRG
jgi:3-oxoacyl-[acyl-carrier protein] reductase